MSPRLGRPRVHARSLGSTNDLIRDLALAGAPHGTLVTTDEQTAGRGRQGRRWSAPPGGSLLMSLLLRDGAGPAHLGPATLPLAAGVAACEAIGPQARLKWPNDVVLERDGGLAKLAGILAEGRPQEGWTVLGIGINVSLRLEELDPELRATAATLARPREAREQLLDDLLRSLEERFQRPREDTLERWRELDALSGRRVSWAEGEGIARGIDSGGRLIVDRGAGATALLEAGEVHLRPAGPA